MSIKFDLWVRYKKDQIKRSEVTVGFSAEYAVYVHEMLHLFHPVGQAKFLEDAMKTEAPALREIIRSALRSGKTLGEAQLLAGQHLLARAKELCPVDTGHLRDSGFVRTKT